MAKSLLCGDYLRLMVIGDMTSYELEYLMGVELETHEHEKYAPSHVLSRDADALPGIGIVAAVLGIVITMQAPGGSPESIGLYVAAVLVGTYLTWMCDRVFTSLRWRLRNLLTPNPKEVVNDRSA